jgi:hypothetical protein
MQRAGDDGADAPRRAGDKRDPVLDVGCLARHVPIPKRRPGRLRGHSNRAVR